MLKPSLHQVPDLIDWHEGMLLTPRHFEQLTQRYEDLLQYGILQSSSFSWGVRKLRIDPAKLLRGQFCVVELEAVMPDGLGVSFDATKTEVELTCDLASLAETARLEGTTVHLLVPASSSIRAGKDLSRFVSCDEGLGDTIRDADESIPRLRPRLQIVAGGDTISAKYVSLPLAKLEYRNEVYALADYMPPCSEVAADSPVGILCSNTVRRIRERAVYLSQQIHTFSASGRKQFGETQRVRVRSMVAALPGIEALLFTGCANPFALYTAYCGLAGHLSVLSENLVPPVFPPYRHLEILESFRSVDLYLNAVLREGIPENYMPVPFLYHEGVFSLVFESEWAARRLILSLRFPSGTAQLDAISWGEQSLIGAEDLQKGMRERRVLGAPRHYLQNEEGLVPGADSVLFQLSYDPEYIHLNESLQILGVPSQKGVRPSEIVLYIKTG